jgi:hypothetical protein
VRGEEHTDGVGEPRGLGGDLGAATRADDDAKEGTMSSQELFSNAEIISTYTRAQAIEDGCLVDMTEWASTDRGFMGGFTCPVAMTAKLWAAVERPVQSQDTRGRAHDVLFMASLALRGAMRRGEDAVSFRVILQVGRTRKQVLRAVADGDGVTIGFREDEW